MHDNTTLNARKNGELVAPAPRKRHFGKRYFGKRQLGKRYFGEAGSAMSHGRLPLESRSHGRAVVEFFSSAAALARSTLMRSRSDSVAAGGATVSEWTWPMKLVLKINAMKRTFITVNSTFEASCTINLAHNDVSA